MTVQTAAFLVGTLTVDTVRLIVVPVVVAALTSAAALTISRSGDAVNRRRDQYAQAVQTLVAWVEFPYRVRRRTDDDPVTLTGLAELGQDIQERLACHQAWIATEHPPVATSYTKTRQAIGPIIGAAITEAWNTPPIRTAAQMNLGDWGPGAKCAPVVAAFQHEVELRFGFRRLLAWVKL